MRRAGRERAASSSSSSPSFVCAHHSRRSPLWECFSPLRPALWCLARRRRHFFLPRLHLGLGFATFPIGVPAIVRTCGGGGAWLPGPWHSSEALQGTGGGT